jgi:hypothetical protein
MKNKAIVSNQPTAEAWDDQGEEVPVYTAKFSDTIKKYIPLHRFSKDFREMYVSGFLIKVFLDYHDKITAVSTRNTEFVPKISSDPFNSN